MYKNSQDTKKIPNKPAVAAKIISGNLKMRTAFIMLKVGIVKEATAVAAITITMAGEIRPTVTAAWPITRAPTILMACPMTRGKRIPASISISKTTCIARASTTAG